MDIKFFNQPREVKMIDILKRRLRENFDEVWIVSGIAKDSGLDLVMNLFENAVLAGSKLNVMVGIDRKNTSKDILVKLLSIGSNLSVHVNSEQNKVETRFYAFESNNSDSYVYLSGGKFSEGGLCENVCLLTEIKYSVEEHENFKIFKHQMLQGVEGVFKNVDRDDILLLATKGEIVSRIIDRKIPSISELYGGKEQAIGEQIYDESTGSGMLKIDNVEDIDIEIEDGIEIRKNVELEVEKEAKKDPLEGINKTEEDLKRLLGMDDKIKDEKNKKTRIIKGLKESDFKNMTTLIIEAGKITKKGVGAEEFKIPKSLAGLMNDFLNFDKINKLELEITDNRDNSEYNEKEDSLQVTLKGASIKSKKLNELDLEEDDIVRLIKLDVGRFKCEVIRKGTKEYDIWERYCTNSISGTGRRFGII